MFQALEEGDVKTACSRYINTHTLTESHTLTNTHTYLTSLPSQERAQQQHECMQAVQCTQEVEFAVRPAGQLTALHHHQHHAARFTLLRMRRLDS